MASGALLGLAVLTSPAVQSQAAAIRVGSSSLDLLEWNPGGSGCKLVRARLACHSARVNLALTEPPQGEVRVTVDLPAGSADLIRSNRTTLTFTPANHAELQSVTFTGIDDAIHNPGDRREAEVTFTAAGGRYDGVSKRLPVRVHSEDVAGIELDRRLLRFSENNGSASYRIRLTSMPTGGLEVHPGIADAADAGAVAIVPAQLGFTARNWKEWREVTVTGVDDEVDDPGGQRVLTLAHRIPPATVQGANDGYRGAPRLPSLFIELADDDETPVASVSADRGVVAEDAGSAAFAIRLSPAPRVAATVHYRTRDGSAAAASGDYTPVAATAVRFAPGDTEKKVSVAILDDDLDETTEHFTVQLLEPENAVLSGSESSALVGIQDNDGRSVNLSKIRLNVDERGGVGTYTLVLGSQPTGDVTLMLTSSDPSVATVAPSAMTFTTTTWDQPQAARVTGRDDSLLKARGTDIVHDVAGGGYGDVAVGAVEIRLIDDEANRVELAFDPATVTVGENGGTAAYDIELDRRPLAPVTVTLSIDNPRAASLFPTRLRFTPARWNRPQRVRVTGTNDEVARARTARISHSIRVEGEDAIDGGRVTVNVTDDDRASIAVSDAALTVTEKGDFIRGSGGDAAFHRNQASYGLVLGSEPAGTVTVTPRASGPIRVSPAALRFDAHDWDEVKLFEVTGVDDAIDNLGDRRSASIGHRVSGGGYDGIAAAGLTVTVLDDEPLPALSVMDAAGGEAEGKAVFEARLSAESGKVVRAGYATGGPGDTATAGDDYTAVANGVLSFAAGETATEIEVAVADDWRIEPSEAFALTLSNPVNATLGDGVATGTIEDDDVAGVSVSPETLTVAEADDPQTPGAEEHRGAYEVALDAQPTGEVRVNVRSADEAVATVSPKKLTFGTGDWSRPQTVTVKGRRDAVAGNRTVKIVHTARGGGYGMVDIADVTVTVTDDEPAPEVSIEDVTVAEDVAGGEGEFSLAMSLALLEPVTVNYTVADGTATRGTDFVLDAGEVAFAAGATAAGLPFRVIDDETDEGASENFTVTLSAPQGSGVVVAPGKGTATATIADDDGAGVRIDPPRLELTETGTGATGSYRVRLNTRPAGEVTVTPGGGDPGIVHLPRSEPLIFGPGNWEIEQAVRVNAVADALAGDRGTTVTHGVSGYGSVTSAPPVDVRVVDDDGPARLSIADASIAEDVSGGAGTLGLSLAPASIADLPVTYTVADGTAVGGKDYQLESGTLVIPAGGASADLAFRVSDDAIDEGAAETFTVRVAAPHVQVARGTATVTITDDDRAGVTVKPLSLTVPEDGAATGTYRVRLDSDPEGTATVRPRSDDTIVGLSPESLSFTSATWADWQNVDVVGVQDNRADDRTATITHTPGGAGGYGRLTGADIDSVTVTVTDDDVYAVTVDPLSLTIDEADNPATEANEHQGFYTVVLDVEPTGPVTVTPASTDPAIAGVSPDSLTFETSDWNVSRTVTVTAQDDDLPEPAGRSLSIRHTASGGGYGGVDIDSVSVSVRDDEDDASIRVIVDPESVQVAEDGGTATYNLSLGRRPATRFDIYPYDRDLDSRIATFSASNIAPVRIRPADWEQAHPVTVTGVPDSRFGERTLIVRHVVHRGGTGRAENDTTVRVTVLDDENRPELSIDNVEVAENISGGRARFTLSASVASVSEFPVNYTVADGTATAGSDYELASGQVSFPPGSVERFLYFDLIDDDSYESAETFTVTLSLPPESPVTVKPGYGVGTATIYDDDKRGVQVEPLEVSLHETGTDAAGSYRVRLLTQPADDETVTVTPSTVGTGVVSLPENPALTFDASTWKTWQTVPVRAVNDRIAGNREAVIRHAVSGYGSVTGAPDVTVKVSDDDAGIQLDPGDGLVVPEHGGETGSYRARLAAEPTATVTVTFDYDASAVLPDRDSLTFTTTDWNEPQTVTVTGVNDDIDNPGDERRTVIGHRAAGGGYPDVDLGAVPVRVLDDDTAGVEVDPQSLTVNEHRDGFAPYRVRLASEPPGDVTVTVTSADEAIATANRSRLDFSPSNWRESQAVRVRGVPDDTRGQRTTRITHGVAGYGAVTTADAVLVTVEDHGDQGMTVSLPEGWDSLSVPEDGSATASYTLVLDTQPTDTVRVDVMAEAAHLEVDKTGLVFDTGDWNQPQTVTVTGVDDDIDNPGDKRTTLIRHSARGGDYQGLSGPGVTVHVIDDDEQAAVRLEPAELRLREGESATYTLSMTAEPLHPFTVYANPADIDAAVARFSHTGSRQVRLDAENWKQGETVTVTGLRDGKLGDRVLPAVRHWVHDGSETAELVLMDRLALEVTVIDNDAGVVVEPTYVQVSEDGAATGAYSLTLKAEPTGPVTIDVSSGDPGAARVDKRNLVFPTATWSEPQSVTVTGVEDEVENENGARLVDIAHSAAGGGYDGVAVAGVRAEVLDNDGPRLVVSPRRVTVSEPGSTGARYTVALNKAPAGRVRVRVASANARIARVDPARLDFGRRTWNEPQEVTVTAVNDDIDNAGDARTLTVTNTPSGADFDDAAAVAVHVTVADDDEASRVEVPARIEIREGETRRYDLRLTSRPLHGDVTVQPLAADLRPDDFALFHAGDPDLRFSNVNPVRLEADAWRAGARIDVAAREDDRAGDRSFRLRHDVYDGSNGRGAAGYRPAIEIVILDNDRGVSVSRERLRVTDDGASASTYQVTLDGAPTATVTLAVESSLPEAAAVSPPVLEFTTENWREPQTVTVTGVLDAVDNPGTERRATVTHAAVGGGYDGYEAPTVEVEVLDDDGAGVLISETGLSLDEAGAGGSGSYTVRLSSEPPGEVTVAVSIDDAGVATSARKSLAFTPATWNDEQTVNVTAVMADGAEDRRTRISHPVTGYGEVASGPPVEVTVLDSERGVTVHPTVVTVSEDGNVTDEYSVVLTARPLMDVRVDARVRKHRPFASLDRNTLTFTPDNWKQPQAVRVTGIDEPHASRTAGNRRTGIRHRVYDYGGAAAAAVEVVVTDDDAALMRAPAALTVSERAGASLTPNERTYGMHLSALPGGKVTVKVRSGDTGIARVSPEELSFDTSDWSDAKPVTVTGVNDDIDNSGDARTVEITHEASGGGYGGVADRPVAVTVEDEDTAGIRVNPANLAIEAENASGVVYRLRLTSEPSGPVTVAIGSDGTGVFSVSPAKLHFGPGNWNRDQEVRVTPGDDSSVGNRTGTIRHSIVADCSDYCDVDVGEVTVGVSILDDETLPEVSVAPASATENVESGRLFFTVNLSRESMVEATVDYATSDDSASQPGDYTGTSGTLGFPAGTTRARIEVPILDDDLDEGASESFRLTLGPGVANATVSSSAGVALGTIVDDDEAGLETSPARLTLAEGSRATYQVRLTSEPTGNVTVTETPTPAGGVQLDISELTFTPTDWHRFQTVTVSAADDGRPGARSLRIAHGCSGGGYDGVAPTSLPVSVTDNEAGSISVPAGVTVSEAAGAGHSAKYEVSLTRKPSKPVRVRVTSADPSVATVLPEVLVFDETDWSTPIEAIVTAVDDWVDNPDPGRMVRIDHLASSEDGRFDGQAAQLPVRIQDNDRAAGAVSPTVLRLIDEAPSSTQACVFFPKTQLIDDLCHTAQYGVVLNSQPLAPITVGIVPEDAGALSVSPSSLEFTPENWSVTQLVTLQAAPLGAGRDTDIFRVEHRVRGGSEADGYHRVNLEPVRAHVYDTDIVRATPVFRVSDESVAEGGTAGFTLSFSREAVDGGLGLPVNSYVEWSTGADDRPGAARASSGSDFTPVAATRILLPGTPLDWSTRVTVTTLDDALVEADETFSVNLVGSSFPALLGDTTGYGTIEDNDAVPELEIDSVTVAEGATASFTLSLSAASGRDVTVTVSTADGSAIQPDDYIARAAASVTIAAGERTASFDVETVDDSVVELNETFTVALTSPTNATLKTDGATGTATITDDDEVTVVEIGSVGIGDVEVDEGDTAVFIVSLSAVPDQDVTVVATTADGTATAPGDYTHTTGTVTIASGQQTATFPVPTAGDVLDEPEETFQVVLSDASAGAVIANGTGTGTINDKNVVPEVEIDSVAVTEGEPARFTLSLSAVSGRDVTVTASTADGTAIQPDDYIARAAASVTIAAGDRTASFDVETVDDSVAEQSETFTVALTSPTNATLKAGGDTGAATITDNDEVSTDDEVPTDNDEVPIDGDEAPVVETGSVGIGDVEVDEGDTAIFTVTLSAVSDRDVTVVATTADGTATAPGDYTHTTGTVTIASGQQTATFPVRTAGDVLDEPEETFQVFLSDASAGAVIVDNTGTGTIVDNDAAPEVEIDSVAVTEGEPARFTLSLSAASGRDVTVTASTADGTAIQPDDYIARTAVGVTIPAGGRTASFDVETVDDSVTEQSETFTVALTSPTNATLKAVGDTGTATVTDNDEAPEVEIGSVGIGDVEVGEGDTAIFTVTLSPVSDRDLTVTAMTTDGTATAPGDYTRTTGTVTIAAGQRTATFPVSTAEDALDEPAETFRVVLSDAGAGAVIANGIGTGTINDNDGVPEVEIDSVTVAEGATATFTLSLSAVSGRDVTVTASTADGTAIQPDDYRSRSGIRVTVPAGDGTTNFDVETVDDSVTEQDETFTVTLTAPANATLNTRGDVGTATVTDNDVPRQPTVRIDARFLDRLGSTILRNRIDRVNDCIDHAVAGVASRASAASPGETDQDLEASGDLGSAPDLGLAQFSGGPGSRNSRGPRQALNSGSDASGRQTTGDHDRSALAEAMQAMNGRQIAFPVADKDPARAASGDMTFCAGGDYFRLSNIDDGLVPWDAEMLGAHAGLNSRLGERLLVGLDAAWYGSDIGGGLADRRGTQATDWQLDIKSLHPYGAWVGSGGRRLWVMGGFGGGDVRIGAAAALPRQSASLTTRSAALGGVLPLLGNARGFSLNFRADGWHGRFDVQANEDRIARYRGRTTGLRALLEGDWRLDAQGPNSLNLLLRMGAQYDDAAGGSALEMGSGLEWSDAVRGVSMALNGRALFGEDGVQDWGAGIDARLDPPGGAGPMLTLSTVQGNTADGTQALWDDGLGGTVGHSGLSVLSLDIEAGWGFLARRGAGIWAPFVGFSRKGAQARAWTIGVRLTMGELQLDLAGQRQEEDATGETDHRIVLDLSRPF